MKKQRVNQWQPGAITERNASATIRWRCLKEAELHQLLTKPLWREMVSESRKSGV
jgi:hypothetical protein